MMSFPAANAISEIIRPTQWSSEKSDLLVRACSEMAQFHYENSSVIKNLYDKYRFHPSQIKSEKDLHDIPAIGVTAMKYHLLTSRPEEKATLVLTSSGTSGQKTQIWFDEESLARVQRMLDVLLEEEGLTSKTPTNYLVFTYNPDQAKDLGIAFSCKNQTRFAPIHNVHYAIEKKEGDWKFDKERIEQIFDKYAQEDLPIKMTGMPSFVFEFIQHLQSKNKRYQFRSDSSILTGGGWKAAEDKQITRSDFRRLCEQMFGIPEHRVRDGYGMAEHSAPYFECKEHRFHIPAYNRLLIRDPKTLRVLPDGEQGLLELITPFNTMMPNLAILSTDWAIIDPEPCPCGANSPTFQLLGRAGTSKHKGCAISADDIVKRSST